jgi:cation diffusion facilitator CzcD-associated flavoprotein CzcO
VVYQREPGWINPKPVRTYTNKERQDLANRWSYRWMRVKGYVEAARTREGGDVHKAGSRANLAAMARCESYIQSVFKDRPDLAEMVTPDYPYFGKRPIKDSNFYPTLLRDNVELVPFGVESVTPSGLVDSRGVERETDVLVMATGFKANVYLSQLEVRGRGGVELHDAWAGEPAAFLGISVPGFPNFFMLYGPNTNSPVTLFMLESQAKLIVRAVRRFRGRRVPYEVTKRAFDLYDAWMQKQMVGSVWSTSNNYFKTDSGRVVTQWPVNPTVYWVMTRVLPRLAMRPTPRRGAVSASEAQRRPDRRAS